MNLRDWLNQNSALATVVAVIVLIFALGAIVWQNKKPSHKITKYQWYYDTGSGKLFPDAFGKLAPIKAPSGEDGVTAFAFWCDGCDSEPEILYLTRYTEESKAMMLEQRELMRKRAEEMGKKLGNVPMMDPMMMRMGGQETASVDDPTDWVPVGSIEANEIMQVSPDLMTCDGDEKPKMDCRPSEKDYETAWAASAE